MAKIDPRKISKLLQSIESGKNQPMWSGGRRGGRGPENTKVYSQAEVDEINRVNQQAGKMAQDNEYLQPFENIVNRNDEFWNKELANDKVNVMNKFEGGAFQDIFPRYQENFQFSGKAKGPYGKGERPTTFKVRRDPAGYRTTADGTFRDIELMQPDIPRSDVPDVARMNSYGNGDFIDSQGLLSDKPTYVRGNDFPNNDYLMAPKLKIDQGLKAGDMNLKQTNGQLFGSNDDWWKTLNLDELDN